MQSETTTSRSIIYRDPDFSAPLDVEAHRQQVPVDGTVKGMFFQSVTEEVRKVVGTLPAGMERHVPFRDYPLIHWIDYLVLAARTAYPQRPLREALRRLGLSMFPAFYASMVGKVVFSVAGGDLHRSLPLYPKIWSVISNHATAEVDELTSNRVVIRQRQVWDFVDSFELGSLEGGMRVFGKNAHVRVAVLSPCDADFEITW